MFVNSPEKVIIGDDPAHEEGEEGHEEELGDKTNQGSDWLLEHLDKALFDNTKYNNNNKHLEHLDNDADVQLGAHVDGVEQHHDHHDQGAELVPKWVVHDDVDGGRDLGSEIREDV